jgi:hypothetical protein
MLHALRFWLRNRSTRAAGLPILGAPRRKSPICTQNANFGTPQGFTAATGSVASSTSTTNPPHEPRQASPSRAPTRGRAPRHERSCFFSGASARVSDAVCIRDLCRARRRCVRLVTVVCFFFVKLLTAAVATCEPPARSWGCERLVATSLHTEGGWRREATLPSPQSSRLEWSRCARVASGTGGRPSG